MNENKMLSLLLSDERGQIRIGKGSSYRLLGEKGLLSANGYSPSDELPARMLELTVEQDPTMESEETCDSLLSRFCVGSRGVLSADRGRGVREIDYEIFAATLSRATLYAPLRAELKLSCPEIWFRDKAIKRVSISESEPGLSFPFTSCLGGGVTGGMVRRSAFLYLDNEGELPVGIEANLYARAEGVADPFLHCADSRVTMLGELHVGDSLFISTCEGERAVRLNGESTAFARQSRFFQIAVGRSLVIASAAKGFDLLEGELCFRQRYLGV